MEKNLLRFIQKTSYFGGLTMNQNNPSKNLKNANGLKGIHTHKPCESDIFIIIIYAEQRENLKHFH
jgi:hypothetical protein